MDSAISRSAGKEQFPGQPLVIKLAGGAHTISEGIRRPAIGVNARTRHDGYIRRAAVIGLTEAKHLRQRKGSKAHSTDCADLN